ncbi:MAG TPA: LysM peptidoglycan-binding domain-containing protein [Acidobacteriaceae bacterium]|nr:LysM peptidoglycan-binding domain-containing protein [Acidobacteriaceae bacterium]
MKYLLLPIASGALLLLCGCPAQQPGAPASASSHATAPTLSSRAPAPTAEKTSTAATKTAIPENSAQQDETLIAASKKAYDTGISLYQSGEYQAAREDFDRAVDIFLTSGRDLKTDSVLSDAFEQRVDAINALELDSLQQSNGFSQQDQTPVGVANDVTFPVDPNLLARAQADLKVTHSDLPLVVNDYVASYINYFTNTRKGHNTIENSLSREGLYRSMVEQVLTDAGVPKDLIYLAIAESGFRPRAVNARSGAGGMWQFMPHGDYGLARNAWVDERFDPEKSTRAYARYIKELHEQFGDWYLAMAAYDWGAGKVQRAVQRTGYADFWELYQRNVLPAETKNYVPIIVAAAIMAKNPSQYGLSDIPVDPPLRSDTVTTDSSINLHLVADLVGATTEQIQELNPSLLQMSTPRDFPFDLHLPPGTAPLFQQRLALVPEEHRNAWRFHIATQADTLASIAQTFHVTTKELAAANGLDADDSLHANQEILIPAAPPLMGAHMRYRVRRGDTVVTLADRFGVTTGQLRRWNRLHGNRLPVGRTIYVSEPVRTHRRRSRYAHGKSARGSSRSHAVTHSPSASKAHRSVTPSRTKTSSRVHRKKKKA